MEKECFREEVNIQDVTFSHGAGNITLIASVMFGRRTNVPTDLAMFTKGCTSVGASMSHNFGARQSNGCMIEIKVAKKRSMGGQRRMDSR